MRKLFYLLAVLTIFNGMAGVQGGLTCTTLNINCPEEQVFLDSVEAKLFHTIDRIKNGENIPITLYEVNPGNAYDFLRIRLTNQEIKDSKLPKTFFPTYQFELVINWDTTLSKGYILGFSKEYGYEKSIFEYSRYKGPQYPGIYFEPFYHIALANYKSFLNQKEMDRLYKIIQKNFINYINVDTGTFRQGFIPTDTNLLCYMYSDTSSLSRLTINLDKPPPFILMPLSYWVNRFKDWIFDSWQVPIYKDAFCTDQIIRPKKYDINDIFGQIDTVKDENGDEVPIVQNCSIVSITVAERWGFDTINNTNRNDWAPYAMIIKREIQSIGINTKCNEGFYVPNAYDKTIWVRYKELNSVSRHNHFNRYQDLLDEPLFNKLHCKSSA